MKGVSETPIPASFKQEAQEAIAQQDAGKLTLLGLEAQGLPWEVAAHALIGQSGVRSGKTWERVILFTGHRIDSPQRKTPRFPAAKEPVAREAIRRALEQQPCRSAADVLGVAGGANGGDLLFLESCEELGMATEMALALPPDEFAKASVENDDPRWMERFAAQLAKHSDVPILATSEALPEWLKVKENYDLWQRNNLWLMSEALSHRAQQRSLIALWDGEAGDGPGGTEHMVSMAKEHGMDVVVLNTKELFALASTGAG